MRPEADGDVRSVRLQPDRAGSPHDSRRLVRPRDRRRLRAERRGASGGDRRARRLRASSPPTASPACARSSARDLPRAPPADGRCCPLAARRASTRDKAVETLARVLLRRYGVVFRRLLTREAANVPWRELARVYRRLEARGEIRGGRFVSGMSGEQFALPDAVERLREVRRSAPDDRLITLSAADPLEPHRHRHRRRSHPLRRVEPHRLPQRRAGRGDGRRHAADARRGRSGDCGRRRGGRRRPPRPGAQRLGRIG